jgi:hypothetical protein
MEETTGEIIGAGIEVHRVLGHDAVIALFISQIDSYPLLYVLFWDGLLGRVLCCFEFL